MTIREADPGDIQHIQAVRNAVKENTLSTPSLVTDEDCRVFLTERGKGWVAEVGKEIVGFAIADLTGNNIWALFVHPAFDRQGIGRKLHDTMLNWYFKQTEQTIWLGTAPETRAAGWREVGTHGRGEIKFEMTYADWKSPRLN